MKTAYEIAEWLNNSDGHGASDEEFIKMFALLERMMDGRRVPRVCEYETMIKGMNVDLLCNRLKSILTEIQQNV